MRSLENNERLLTLQIGPLRVRTREVAEKTAVLPIERKGEMRSERTALMLGDQRGEAVLFHDIVHQTNILYFEMGRDIHALAHLFR